MMSWRVGLTALVVLSICGCGLMMSSEEQGKVAAACAGEAVAGTQPHAKAQTKQAEGFAVFVQESSDGPYKWSVDGVHFRLKQPRELAEVNTVFCMDAPKAVPQGACAFDETSGIGVAGVQVVELERKAGPTFARVGQQRSARLVDPSTGKTISEHTVNVDARACEDTIGEPSESNFLAMVPTGISFADWATEQMGVEK